MEYPKEFSVKDYAKWHMTEIKEDEDFLLKLEKLREAIFDSSRDELKFLDELIQFLFVYCSQEYKTQHSVKTIFETPLTELLIKKNEDSYKELLFKSVSSIVNKLWRKNKSADPYIRLNDIRSVIKDLVRTEILASTLEACKFLATRFNPNIENLLSGPLKKKFKKYVTNIVFEPEMKMASGYFAYHGLVKFKSNLVVEIQIYSSLMKSWRNLSHIAYERVRINPPEQYDYGTSRKPINFFRPPSAHCRMRNRFIGERT